MSDAVFLIFKDHKEKAHSTGLTLSTLINTFALPDGARVSLYDKDGLLTDVGALIPGGTYTVRVQEVPAPPAAQASPQQPVNYQERFLNLLKQTYLNKPKMDIVKRVSKNFAARMIVVDSADDALDLYELAKSMPGTATKVGLRDQKGISINGPFSVEMGGSSVILSAVNRKGVPLIIKVLTGTNAATEIVTAQLIEEARLKMPDIPLVPTSSDVLHISGDDAMIVGHVGHKVGLIMPHYVCVVAELPQLFPEALVSGGQRILSALGFLHTLGMVHMDVKGMNVFVDQDGAWRLGDYGSTTWIGQPITSYSVIFYFANIENEVAHPRYDFYMLAVMLLCEYHKKNWQEMLYEDGINMVNHKKLLNVVDSLVPSDFKTFLSLLLKKFGEK